MTRPALLSLLSALLLVALTGPLISGSSWFSHAPQEPVAEDADETPLQREMGVVKDGMRKLRRGLSKADDIQKALPVILEMQAAMQFAKTQIPPMSEAIADEVARATFIRDYRKGVVGAQSLMLDLEVAILDGDTELAQNLYKKLKSTKEDGHEQFTED
jgi:cytochrome b562